MRVYLTGAFEYMDRNVGFGNASYYIYTTMKKLGVDVHVKELDNDEEYDADIEICFDQPGNYKFMCPTSYKIGYTPWESTEFMPSWYKAFEKVDEVWVTSFWNKVIFQNKLPNKKIFTYQHGIDHAFKPRKRSLDPSRPFTFLFIGEPFYRKDGQLVAKTFAELFGNNPEYRLIIKGTNMNTIRIYDPDGNVFGSPEALYDNIITITNLLSPEQMIELYNKADAFVYPTWGEGFGFNPLQALAMGIPTISTTEWSDYEEFITMQVGSSLHPSPWPEIHPGLMLKPNHSDFKKCMKLIKDNYDVLSDFAFKKSFEIHKKFDWERVTKPAVFRLQKIYENRELKTST